eukprot:10185814-Heterocapsa_arctica.AAC.2
MNIQCRHDNSTRRNEWEDINVLKNLYRTKHSAAGTGENMRENNRIETARIQEGFMTANIE